MYVHVHIHWYMYTYMSLYVHVCAHVTIVAFFYPPSLPPSPFLSLPHLSPSLPLPPSLSLPPSHSPTHSQNMLQTKQMLYKKVAEAERSPFFLHPHQVTSIYPFLPFSPSPVGTNQSSPINTGKFSQGIYPLIQQSPPNLGLTMLNTGTPVLTPPSSVSTSSTLTTQASSNTTNLVLSCSPQAGSTGVSLAANMAAPATPPRAPYTTTQFYAPFVKCPISPPTPSGIATLGVLSPWNVAAMSQINVPQSVDTVPKSSASSGTSRRKSGNSVSTSRAAQSVGNNPSSSGIASSAQILPQHVLSPRPGFTSLQSPLGFLHSSPLSPMMLIHSGSPYPSSISSCPSVSSSSGCSSDGGASFTAGLQAKNYAPTEYHVGPRRPLSEKLTEEDSVSEGANSSGRNTPVDNTEDDDDSDGTTPNQTTTVFPSVPENSRASTFTPFTITSQGPSMMHSSTPHVVMVNGDGSRRGVVAGQGSGRVRTESKKTNSVDLTCRAASYPYSVESGGHSVRPLSVESNTHVSLCCVCVCVCVCVCACACVHASVCVALYVHGVRLWVWVCTCV